MLNHEHVSTTFMKTLITLIFKITFLVTCNSQFGFKRKHATDLCIYTVKSVIKYYNYFRSPIYTCFLDASKTFDRDNHCTPFKKLLIRGVPNILVRIVCILYQCQQLIFVTIWRSSRRVFR